LAEKSNSPNHLQLALGLLGHMYQAQTQASITSTPSTISTNTTHGKTRNNRTLSVKDYYSTRYFKVNDEVTSPPPKRKLSTTHHNAPSHRSKHQRIGTQHSQSSLKIFKSNTRTFGWIASSSNRENYLSNDTRSSNKSASATVALEYSSDNYEEEEDEDKEEKYKNIQRARNNPNAGRTYQARNFGGTGSDFHRR